MSEQQRFTDADLAHYHAHGYVFLENFFSPEELTRVYENVDQVIPGWRYAVDPSLARPDDYQEPEQLPANPRFPFPGDMLNEVTFHPELRRFAASVAGHDHLFCEQSDLTFKCQGHSRDVDQQMHMDFGNHTLAYPSENPKYWQTTYLIYYTDVTDQHAPTAVVPWEHYKDELHWPASHSRSKRPDLYEKEILGVVPAGTVLAYSTRTYHRGTGMLGNVGRVAHFVSYAPKDCPWMGIVTWPVQGVRQDYHRWMAKSTIEERELLGFPAPGHEYWTQQMVDGVQARFPEMDMAPYREALALKGA